MMRVLLLGASGMFGKRVATLLAQISGLHIVLAGRQLAALDALKNTLSPEARCTIDIFHIDLEAADCEQRILQAAPHILIDTCGPFQSRDYRLPRLAIAHAFHYIDLADAPEYVANIGTLDALARAANILVTAGASTVPALSSAVIDAYRHRFASLHSIDIGITPGNRAERGLATVRSILGGAGKPHAQFIDATIASRSSWSSLRRHRYATPVGARWLAYCPVPDALVLPQRYPGLQRLEFRAGLELHRMHFGLWLGAWLVRLSLIASLEPMAPLAKRISERWLVAGSDTGAMHISLSGRDAQGIERHIEWQLIATEGDGPFVPAAAAASLVRRLLDGTLTARGALPCVGLLSLEDFATTLSGRAIRFQLQEPA
jgi:saccharopine dehydrogenase-like NADP-dependent oxidoreductase